MISKIIKHFTWNKRKAKVLNRIKYLDKAKVINLGWYEFHRRRADSRQALRCLESAMKYGARALKLSAILAEPRTSLCSYIAK